MHRTIVYLVGFMGAGKTSVGRCLAELLGWTFIDLDEEIEKQEDTPIREIFRRRGEPCFREIERGQLERVSRLSAIVVALGGGAFCSDDNQAIVRSTGVSVWLNAPIELLYARCAGDAARPLFTTREEMESLLRNRLPLYQKADYVLDMASLSVDAAAERIFRFLSP